MTRKQKHLLMRQAEFRSVGEHDIFSGNLLNHPAGLYNGRLGSLVEQEEMKATSAQQFLPYNNNRNSISQRLSGCMDYLLLDRNAVQRPLLRKMTPPFGAAPLHDEPEPWDNTIK